MVSDASARVNNVCARDRRDVDGVTPDSGSPGMFGVRGASFVSDGTWSLVVGLV